MAYRERSRDFAEECGCGEAEGEHSGASLVLPHGVPSVLPLPSLMTVAQVISLSKEDVDAINKLDRNLRVCNKPNEKGTVWGWTAEQLGWD